jgi:hypothetical protein
MQIKIDKPTKYVDSNIFNLETGFSYFQIEDGFYLSGNATEAELITAFAAHNPLELKELTVAEKLASVGLSVDDLKAALGL